jgi:V/A-type H+-transporting ATPase subunit E
MASIKKGLAAIANEILEDAKNDSETIIRDAEKKAEKILREAKTEAEQSRNRFLAETKEKSESEQKRTISLTALEIKNEQLQVKEEYINAVFGEALARLKQFVESKSYPDYLLEFIEEAAKRIESDNLVVYVNSKDQELLANDKIDQISKKLNINLTLANETKQCIGGCIVKTSDGKLSFDNTFEKRLQSLKPLLRLKIAKKLFEKED